MIKNKNKTRYRYKKNYDQGQGTEEKWRRTPDKNVGEQLAWDTSVDNERQTGKGMKHEQRQLNGENKSTLNNKNNNNSEDKDIMIER